MILEQVRVIYLIMFMANCEKLELHFSSLLINCDYLLCVELGLVSELFVYMGFRQISS